jgi:protein-tyrosine-phosphatase
VAEALFKHYYKGDSVKVRSAGIVVDVMHPYVSRSVMKVMHDKDISIRDDGAKKIDEFVLKWADKLIIVADNISPDMFRGKEFVKGKQVVFWGIPDVVESDAPGILTRVNHMEKLVLDLIKILG